MHTRETTLPGSGDLVRRYQQGDERAFDALYRRHAPMMTGYLRRRTTASHLVEDAVTDAFLLARDKLSSLQEPEAVGSWLLTVARRQLHRLYREDQRIKQAESVAPQETLEAALGTSPDQAETVVEAAALHERLVDVLSPAEIAAVKGLFLNEVDEGRLLPGSISGLNDKLAQGLVRGDRQNMGTPRVQVNPNPHAPSEVQQRLERLPGRQREVLRLSVYRGMRPREIAESLWITPNNARVTLYLARRTLARAMGIGLSTLDQELAEVAAHTPAESEWLVPLSGRGRTANAGNAAGSGRASQGASRPWKVHCAPDCPERSAS